MELSHKKIVFFLVSMLTVFSYSTVGATEYTITTASELSKLSLSPGDVVTMANGTWSNQVLSFTGSGSESQPIILRAETQGEVILTGDSRLSIAGEYLTVDGLTFKDGELEGDAVIQFRTSSSSLANHCRLTNTAILNYNPWDRGQEYKWVSIYGTYNQVDHCSFVGKDHQGALMVVWIGDTPNHHRINNNYFADIPELGANGGETIRIGTSSNSMKDSYAVVENNLFENCDGEIEIISNKSCENIYRNNTFLHCEGTLALRHGNRCSIYGNFFFGDLTKDCGGIRVIGEDHKVYNNYLQDLTKDGFRAALSITNGVPDSPLNRYFQVKNAELVNNTVVNCKYPIYIGAGKSDELSLPPQNLKLINNVVADYVGRTSQAVVYNDTPDGITYTNNMIYAPSKLGDTPDEVDNSDPKLEESDGFYHLKSNSPAIGFGISTVSYLTTDIEGQSRTSTNDAGCDQLADASSDNAPLSSEDIGVLIGVAFDNTGGDDEEPVVIGQKLSIVDAVASTEQNEDGKVNIAANTIDGMLDTRWSGEGIGAYIDLTLEKQCSVAYLKVGHYKGDERSSSFHLMAWESTTEKYDTLLSDVSSTISSESYAIYDFDDVITDKIRLVGLGYSGGTGIWNSYAELELWGWNDLVQLNETIDSGSVQMLIYPNPCYGDFRVKNCSGGDLHIFTLAGSRVYSQLNINSETFISTDLNRGIYLVKVDSEHVSFTERLILI